MPLRLRHFSLALAASCALAACTPPVPPPAATVDPDRIARLEQSLADTDRRLQRTEDNLMLLEARIVDQQQILEEIRRGLAAGKTAVPGPAPVSPPARQTTITLQPPDRPQPAATDLYLQAFADYAAGRYAQAAAGFSRFLDAYAASDYAGNAQYWLAECYLAEKDYENAARAFELTVERYPEGAKAADALLKLAEAERLLGHPERAADATRQLRSRYPESAAAKKSLSTP